jgi:hypothetical protein
MWTGTHDYTPEEWTRFQGWLDRIYDDFTSKVAQGRRLPKEKVLELAKGRIWTGEDADIHLKIFPPEKTSVRRALEQLLGRGEESSEGQAATVALRQTLQMVQPLTRMARALGFGLDPGALAVAPVEPPR